MTNLETVHNISSDKTPVSDDFDDEIERVGDVLPDELDRIWLDGFRGEPWVEENEVLLQLAFWDAARAVIEAMLRAGYTLTPPNK
jgi:hypothetical protein